MTNFCLLVGLIGIVAGVSLTFVAAGVVCALGVVIAAVCYAWQGYSFGQWILSAILCLLFMQIGFVIGLVLKAFLTHRRAADSVTVSRKDLSGEKRR